MPLQISSPPRRCGPVHVPQKDIIHSGDMGGPSGNEKIVMCSRHGMGCRAIRLGYSWTAGMGPVGFYGTIDKHL